MQNYTQMLTCTPKLTAGQSGQHSLHIRSRTKLIKTTKGGN